MDLKKLVISTLVSGLGMWAVAGIWHNLIMASLYESTHAEHEGILILLFAYFVLSFLMTYLFTLIYKGEKPIKVGIKIGVIVGILWVFPHGLAMAGAHDDSVLYVFKNSAWHIVEQGIGGLIIGLIYRSKF